MKRLCILATFAIIFISTVLSAPTKSERAEVDGFRSTLRKASPFLKKALKFYVDNYNVEAQELSTAEIQLWGSLLKNALPYVAPFVSDYLTSGGRVTAQKELAETQFWGALLGTVLPPLLLSRGNGGSETVSQQNTLIQEISQAQRDERASEEQVVKSLVEKLEDAAANEPQRVNEILAAIASLPEEAQTEFLGPMLGALRNTFG